MRPRILDLFCGAGGAAVGYSRAGFDVLGVDIAPQPDYPFKFVQCDAIEMMRYYGGLGEFAAIHASPPCQASSTLTAGTNKGRAYPQLIPETRAALDASGIPYVIENVIGAPIRRDLVLCGEMFGLGVIRHRVFELSGFTVSQPDHIAHRGRVAGWRHGEFFEGPYFAVYGAGGGKGTVEQWRIAMGIDWMTERKEIAESIPPAYTEYIGLVLAATQ